MDFISKAGSYIINNASKALSVVGSKLPNPTLKNAARLMVVVASLYAVVRFIVVRLIIELFTCSGCRAAAASDAYTPN